MSPEDQHKDFETFKKYYTGKMSPEEKSNFESELENDPFAKDAYEGFLLFESDFIRISAIENTNMSFKDKYNLNEEGVVFPLKTVIGIAASIVLLVGGFFIIQNSFSNPKNNLAENKVIENTSDAEIIVNEQEEMQLEDLENDSSESGLLGGWESESFDSVIPSHEALKEKTEGTDRNSNLTLTMNDETQVSVSENNRNDDLKQIGSEQYNQYYKNQKESKKIQGGTFNDSKNKDKFESSKAFYNSIAVEEDILEQEQNSLSNYKSGIEEYNQSNYSQAIQYFNNSVNDKKNVNSSNFYIGMSYFNQNKANKAIRYFDKVINTPSSFSDDAKWYKAISLINKSQKERAKTLLLDLINSNSAFSTAAQKKIDSLN